MIGVFFNNNENKHVNLEDEMTLESLALITEASILENTSEEELEQFLSSSLETEVAVQEGVLMEKSIVRLDKNARINHAQKIAVFTIAKEKNDPKFKKLVTVWRMERALEAELFRKYGNEGLRRAKKAVSKQRQSKSKLVSKVASNVNKQFNTK